MIEYIWAGVLTFGLIISIAYLVILVRVKSYLREYHRSLWEELCQSTTFGSMTVNQNNFSLFISKRQYLQVGDNELVRLCNWLRMSGYLGAACFCIAFLLVMLNALR